MAVIQIAKILIRRGQENQTGIPKLDPGEFGWAEDTENLYIGKRISEGADSDENTRILVERDLDIFRTLSLNTGSVTSAYRYREGTAYLTSTTISTVQYKLDSFNPSLTDFGLVLTTATNVEIDITLPLRYAIKDLFGAPSNLQPKEARRKLLIPAGDYIVSESIELPPYTSLVGEGMGLTNIKFTNSLTSLFKTVDADGNEFGSMLTGINRARDIRIEGMTLQYSTGSMSNSPLLSLDDVAVAKIQDCRFGTYFSSTSTTTYGLTSYGVGIAMRGTDGGVVDVVAANNLHIVNCVFDGLSIGVEGVGNVIRPVIENNIFSNLQQGVKFHTIDTSRPPQNGYVTENRFQNIVGEGIFVGTSSVATNHLSSNNFFAQVGNGVNLSDYTTTSSTTTAVINFIASGNKTINDQFNRRTVANATTTDITFYYNPLVKGSVVINDSTVYNVFLPEDTTTPVARIGLTGQDQKVSVNYQITNNGLSRKGNLLINVAPDGYTSYTDYYNFSQSLTTTGTVFVASTNTSGINVLVIPVAGNTQFVDARPDLYYIVGLDGEYLDKSAIIKSIDTTSAPGFYTIVTQSIDPQFDYATDGATWQLAYGDSALPEFTVNSDPVYVNQNYVMLECLNSSLAFSMNIQYQIDVQQ
jgi:hypothetical protein